MSLVFHISASPRGDRSASLEVARALLEEHRRLAPNDEVIHLDLFATELPPFDGPVLEAKYGIMHGRPATAPQREAWRAVERVAEQFKAADKYVFSLPMWNFSIPYRLKHYFDVIVQPGLTFNFDPASGYTGLVTGRPVVAIYARGGEYASPEAASLDMQKPYLETILGFIGLTDVHSIVVEPTLAGGPDAAKQRLQEAIARAKTVAAEVLGA
ncbi:MAG TPA: FMN-dependent NADH-azoreductase [Planctomycetaceae bacterium]|nr:FMN-dependent NADH-azoreductase [Planctomycetaceae bacterium]